MHTKHKPFAALNEEEITLARYSHEWAAQFDRERSRLLEQPLLQDAHIVHIGSTAVSGMLAKPTIDMMLGMRADTDIAGALAALGQCGYIYYPEFESDTPDRRFCVRRDKDGGRAFHISVVQSDSRFWWDHIVFRNLLRTDAGLRVAYQALKIKLLGRCRFDRAGYVAGKSDFVTSVIERHTPVVRLADEAWRRPAPVRDNSVQPHA